MASPLLPLPDLRVGVALFVNFILEHGRHAVQT
jgi:hypothetical protein